MAGLAVAMLRLAARLIVEESLEAAVEDALRRVTTRTVPRPVQATADTMMPLATALLAREDMMEGATRGLAGEAVSSVVLVALELSKAAWLVAIYDATTDKISRHRVPGGDAAALITLIERARRAAAGRAGQPMVIDCVFEAGYDGY